MYVCICNAVTDREIRAASDLGARTIDDLRECLGVATCCRRCEGCAQTLLDSTLKQTACAGAGD